MKKLAKGSKILILGSGPIVIGQACEFDYSGTQACKALRSAGYQVILINSNPATIMTDPETAHKVYIEPLEVSYVEAVIERELPDALMPTLGGQTALNLALELHRRGVLQKFGVQLLGSSVEAIELCENRELFRDLLDRLGIHYPKSVMVRSLAEAQAAVKNLGLPLILRPNYTLGGGGGGIAYSLEEYEHLIFKALKESPTSEVLVEESILGWYEYELELMRDSKGTSMIVCSIENLDPCGVHTGDSITIAPQQTLPDYEYQEMRNDAFRIADAVGLSTGGANIQFAVDPVSRRRVVIEMNPRVSRSSALASKATGFPIAKIAALVAVGYHLDEITNDITKATPSSYEPALDYVVTKIPKFNFEKFPGVQDVLGTQMRSVGEVMAIGRTFKESLMKALLALEDSDQGCQDVFFQMNQLSYPNSKRLWHIFQAFRHNFSLEDVHKWTGIHPYFLDHLKGIVDLEKEIASAYELSPELLLKAKRYGFSDARIGFLRKKTGREIFLLRKEWGISPGFEKVDTCAGEFASETPYYYSSYWSSQKRVSCSSNSVVIIGSGPNRIGQGIEFDYACVRASYSLKKLGYQVIMVNSNPETVSTDYDTSDFLFFEPLTVEHLNEIMRACNPLGFIAQFGGQTPIKIMFALEEFGWNVLGNSCEVVRKSEDRKLFSDICSSLGLKIPASGVAASYSEACAIAEAIGYPLIARPSYVLGGRRMEIIENQEALQSYFHRNHDIISHSNPCYLDYFLERALEVDVDIISDGDQVIIGGVLEHIEATGVHSGDSMAVLPPRRLSQQFLNLICEYSEKLARALHVRGFLNIQYALKDNQIYVIEANPRSSRTVPFIAKATGYPLVDLGVLAIMNRLPELPKLLHNQNTWYHVKGVVYPFKKFSDADPVLSPEMKSTGETMGRSPNYGEALLKAFIGANVRLPLKGEVFFSLRDKDKMLAVELVRRFQQLGYSISATSGTAQFLNNCGIHVTSVRKIHEGRPHCVDRIRNGEVSLVINTTRGTKAVTDGFLIRRACIDLNIPCITKLETAEALLDALEALKTGSHEVFPL
ncbi:MAG: carbamoyl-phosphate synthase large subunit [Bdellovibrionaceae bacterium]|nr:carbamoyl-phosphate synthase large subunit [Pseudobdellovibrionaceae bacterium]MDW8190937.1 carbamoyl-phosphate synthase large subunit [Pseudobdellovibrionaceae bacterium]